jgi:hypothetical protein
VEQFCSVYTIVMGTVLLQVNEKRIFTSNRVHSAHHDEPEPTETHSSRLGYVVGYSNYLGGGGTESVSFEGYGSYFIQVWSNGHGGTYDLKVFLGIS